MDSILTSIKKLLGIDEFYDHFDADIIMCINSAFSVLNQLGIGPPEGYVITDSTQTWTDFFGDRKDIELVKTYVYMKTRLIFDPPSSSSVIEAFNKQISEFEWRLNVAVENS